MRKKNVHSSKSNNVFNNLRKCAQIIEICFICLEIYYIFCFDDFDILTIFFLLSKFDEKMKKNYYHDCHIFCLFLYITYFVMENIYVGLHINCEKEVLTFLSPFIHPTTLNLKFLLINQNHGKQEEGRGGGEKKF